MRISYWSSDVCSSDLLLATGIEEDNSVYFSLRDSGSGIPAENLAQIFHGFFTTKENGLGIGLAICHSIVAAHGGRSEELRVGQECVSTCRLWWSPYHYTKK